jgi:hypothetical protein
VENCFRYFTNSSSFFWRIGFDSFFHLNVSRLEFASLSWKASEGDKVAVDGPYCGWSDNSEGAVVKLTWGMVNKLAASGLTLPAARVLPSREIFQV